MSSIASAKYHSMSGSRFLVFQNAVGRVQKKNTYFPQLVFGIHQGAILVSISLTHSHLLHQVPAPCPGQVPSWPRSWNHTEQGLLISRQELVGFGSMGFGEGERRREGKGGWHIDLSSTSSASGKMQGLSLDLVTVGSFSQGQPKGSLPSLFLDQVVCFFLLFWVLFIFRRGLHKSSFLPAHANCCGSLQSRACWLQLLSRGRRTCASTRT